MDNINQEEIKRLIQKAEESKRENKLDLSSDEDLSIAIMNLISIEEHFFFTGAKTGKPEYYDLLNSARQMRKELLKRIIKDYEGEVWCISKHLLAASMRLMEVGTKSLGKGDKKEAEDFFKKAYELYSLFWGINLKLVDIGDVKKIDDVQLSSEFEVNSYNNKPEEKKKGFLSNLGEVVNKILDCCRE